MAKMISPDHSILDLMTRRWSPRAFSDRAVEPQKLNQIFEAARWSPSAFNAQPWRFFVSTKDDSAKYEKMLACLVPGNQAWAKSAPVLMIACAATHFAHNGKPNNWARYDVGQAVAYLTLQATALELFVHQMAGFDAETVKQTYSLPADVEPVVATAVGYLGDPATLPEGLQQREAAAGQRNLSGEFVRR